MARSSRVVSVALLLSVMGMLHDRNPGPSDCCCFATAFQQRIRPPAEQSWANKSPKPSLQLVYAETTTRESSEPAESSSDKEQEGTASIPNLTVSLSKSIVGSGVLALPCAVAGLGDTPAQVLPAACLLILGAGATYGYFFQLVGQVCAWTGATSYREAWDKTMGGGTVGSQTVAIAVALKTFLACVAYSMILADSFQTLAFTAGFADVTRAQALMAITGTALLPLCLQKNLSSLGPFSALALLSFAVTVGTLVVRAVDGTYAVTDPTSAATGAATTLYLADLPDHLQPAFGDVSYLPNIKGVVLLCTLATAFVAHYNAPRFFSELRDSTMKRFGRVVTTSYSLAATVFVIVAIAGFSTFGTAAQPMILNSYSPYDPLASACRAFLAGSILLTFPLPFVGLRDGVLDLFQVAVEQRNDTLFTALSVALLAVVTVVAVNVQDLGLVLSVGGGTFSTAVASVFPTLMFCAAVENRKEEFETNGKKSTDICMETLQSNERQALLAILLMNLSVAVGISGVSIALNRVFHWF